MQYGEPDLAAACLVHKRSDSAHAASWSRHNRHAISNGLHSRVVRWPVADAQALAGCRAKTETARPRCRCPPGAITLA